MNLATFGFPIVTTQLAFDDNLLAALVVMADSANAWLRKQRPPALDSQ